jgi:hypothetical protein
MLLTLGMKTTTMYGLGVLNSLAQSLTRQMHGVDGNIVMNIRYTFEMKKTMRGLC